MKKRCISLILILVMIVSLMPTVTFAVNTDFAGGSGTASDPYLILTKTHLNNVRNYLDAHFKLMCDIEFEDMDFAEGGDFYNDGQGWTPIGTDSNYSFTGSFDGNEYAIKNLYINISKSSNVYAGLFGYSKGTIKNLGVINGTVIKTVIVETGSSACIGGVVGYNKGTVENCYNSSTISSTCKSKEYEAHSYSKSGGIAGYNDGSIIQSYNMGDIIASSSSDEGNAESTAGGIAGYNFGEITLCYNLARVSTSSTAWSYIGGIAGDSYGSTISKCYNTGDISTISSYVRMGGIAGTIAGGGCAITNSYNIGNLTATSLYVHSGGIAGELDYGLISDCYNSGDIIVVHSSLTSLSEIYTGGITGHNYDFEYDRTLIKNCYNTGTITSYIPSACLGGITGESSDFVKLKNCYYLDKIPNGIGKGFDTTIKCTADELKQQTTFVGFDFENIWTMVGNKCYPYPELKAIEFALDHMYDNACDTTCDCGYVRSTTHNHQLTYDNDDHFDKCTICGDMINIKPHEFENDCDATCDVCSFVRIATHNYLNKYNATYHWKLCSSCKQIADRYEHSYINKYDTTCDCGYVRTVELPTIDAVSITLNNSIAYNIKVSADISDSNPYVLFTFANKTYKVDKFKKENEYIIFTLKDIAPHYMTENIKAVLYADTGKAVVAACEYETTIENYCKSIKDSKYASIVNAVLNYGAQAQIYSEYKTDTLANRSLTDSEKTIAKSDYFNAIDKEYLTIENDKATWVKHGIILDDKVVIKLSFVTDENIEDLSVMVETEWMEPVTNLSNCFKKEGNKYTLYFDDFLISELDSIFLFTICKDGKPISDTLSYSVESYASVVCERQDISLENLIHALMNYATVSKNY